ncbi:IucA/IucC family protein [Methylomonas sp. TEB]|uniref:IucA/IucC family protein n=1 Tax=Methylomonas sp. TEB TaxID=3398229 RepID=UPI0039F54A3A
MSASVAWHTFAVALTSPHYQTTQRRVLRQLVEALLFEQVLIAEITPNSHDSVCFDITGRTQDGSSVRYRCYGRISDSFGRIRLNDSPVLRISLEDTRPVASLQEFLLETSAIVGTTEVLLARFLREIQQTLLKDTLAQHARQPDASERDLTALEGQLQDGHPYHPCYKSRIGFDPIDNFDYGPEFQPSVRLVWLALRRERATLATCCDIDLDDFLRQNWAPLSMTGLSASFKAVGWQRGITCCCQFTRGNGGNRSRPIYSRCCSVRI